MYTKKIKRKWVLIGAMLLFGACMFVLSNAMAQQDNLKSCDIRTVTGVVSTFDWVGSLLVVDTGVDALSLVVSRETTFRKRERQIMFSEVNLNDAVAVKYYDCGFAGLKAISVTITS
jgi:hypothetical protein